MTFYHLQDQNVKKPIIKNPEYEKCLKVNSNKEQITIKTTKTLEAETTFRLTDPLVDRKWIIEETPYWVAPTLFATPITLSHFVFKFLEDALL